MRILYPALLILAGMFLFTACGGPAPSAVSAKPVQAEVVTVRSESVPAVLQAPGTVQARNRVALSSQINGFVREVRVNAGDTVVAGQVLVTLDAREADSQKDAAQASIEEAQAALAEARKGAEVAQSMRTAAKAAMDLAGGTYARYQKLFETRSVSPQELDEVRAHRDAAAADFAAKEATVAAAQDRLRQIEARIAQASAQLRRADVYVGWSVVKAPSSGRIVERSVDPGSAIFPGSPLIALESTARPQILASLPTTESSRLRIGLEVRVRIPEQMPVQGRVSEIIPFSAPSSHTVQFKVDLPDGFSEITGSYVTVGIPSGTRQALLVPVQSVRESGQLTGVFVVDSSDKARFRLVKMAPYDSERVELLAGLEPGERIIAKLTEQLTDGVSLEIR
jgi:multidrug efflux pump subunit AcrA (membrane-fusion protein)